MTAPITPPLFEVAAAPAAELAPRGEGSRSVAWGNCPGCWRGRTGLVRSAEHLVWREHTYATWAGARMTCPASGSPACTSHERQPTELRAGRATCPHEGSQA